MFGLRRAIGVLTVGAGALGCAAGAGGSGDTDLGVLGGSDGTDTEGTTATIPATTQTSGAAATSTTEGATSESDGSTGEAETDDCVESIWWPDADEDGFGAATGSVSACEAPPGYVDNDGDCADDDADRNPLADEICDGIDNDCDGLLDEFSATNQSCNGCDLFAYGDHGYAVCPLPQTWDSARATCSVMFAGDLVKIDDTGENDAIVAFLQGVSDTGRWFIGLSDSASEGDFVWTDGSAPTFTNWGEGEPNDYGDGEDCSEIWAVYGYTWNDIGCDAIYDFICESPAP
jgi:hypothetical protein